MSKETTISSLLLLFQDQLKYERRLSVHTQIAYEKDLNDWANYLAQEMTVTDIAGVNSMQIRSWFASLRASGISPRSIVRKISALKSFYKFLLRNGVVEVNPLSTMPTPIK